MSYNTETIVTPVAMSNSIFDLQAGTIFGGNGRIKVHNVEDIVAGSRLRSNTTHVPACRELLLGFTVIHR